MIENFVVKHRTTAWSAVSEDYFHAQLKKLRAMRKALDAETAAVRKTLRVVK